MTIEDLEKENRILGERCNQLLKDKGNLTDQITDIKANCDLAIEGRDVKIMELEQKLEQTEKDLADYQFNYPTIKELEKENERLKGDLELWESGGCRATNLFECGVVKELKQQIEKMKVCSNCKHFNKAEDNEYCWNCERHLVNSLDNLKAEEIIKDEWELKND